MTKTHDFTHLGQSLNLHYLPSDELKPYKNNPRTHSKRQIKQIANSIQEFGFTNPILIDENNMIIAGHGRIEAAKQLGIRQVPVVHLKHLSEAQKRAYIIADNKLAENAGWDLELLQAEISAIHELEVDFDLTVMGYEVAEIDQILSDEPQEDLEKILPPPVRPVSQLGDLWRLGEHLLLCADATQKQSYDLLMGAERANAIFTDPPYNVPINGHVCGNGRVKHNEFVMGAGEMTNEEFHHFLKSVCTHMRDFSYEGSLHYVCMDWRHIFELLAAGKATYNGLNNICVWNKTNGGMGTMYRSKHELVAVFKHGTKPHTNNIQLGAHGNYRTNVWDYSGVNSFGNQQSDLQLHPTVKPVAMVADAIKDCTRLGEIVLDPFAGSGSTLIAAETTGRVARCIELDPQYVDVIIRRYQDLTRQTVFHADGETFAQKKEVRHV